MVNGIRERWGSPAGYKQLLVMAIPLILSTGAWSVQHFVDMSGFTAFLLMIGRLGTVELAATNIAFNINTLAFMPMIGFGIAISVTVGQYIGEDRPEMAERSVYSGAHLIFIYM